MISVKISDVRFLIFIPVSHKHLCVISIDHFYLTLTHIKCILIIFKNTLTSQNIRTIHQTARDFSLCAIRFSYETQVVFKCDLCKCADFTGSRSNKIVLYKIFAIIYYY